MFKPKDLVLTVMKSTVADGMEGVHDSWSVYTSVGGGVGCQSGL